MFGGSKFLVVSMIFDKVLMVVLRYGKFMLFAAISILISSYIYFYIQYGWQMIKAHNLINRPEIVFKYFWGYLKYYYYNRSKLPISKTFEVACYLAAPYAIFKSLSLAFNFLKFYLATKWETKFPTVSAFLLQKISLSSGIKNKVNKILCKKPTKAEKGEKPHNTQERTNISQNIPERKNLRK